MTKAELIAAVATKTGLSKTAAAEALEAVPDTLAEALSGGDRVSWSGVGFFEVSERTARKGRNPQTGVEIKIAASKGVKFKAAKALKDSIQ